MNKLNFLINDLSSGGAEKVLSTICNELSHTNHVRVFTLRNRRFYNLNSSIEITNIGLTGLFYLDLILAPIALAYHIRKRKITKIQSHLFYSNYVNILAKLLGTKHTSNLVHCVSFSSKFSKFSFGSLLHKFFIRVLFRYSDLNIFKSEAMKEDYMTTFPDVFNRNRVKVIYNPCNVEEVVSKSKEKLNRVELFDNDGINICIMGRFHETKRQLEIIKIASKFNKSVHLHFIGNGPMLNSCIAAVKSKGLQDRIHFHGILSNPFPMIKSADLYLSYSNAEGFPNALIEALACGKCCVHSDCLSGPSEILADRTASCVEDISYEKYGILIPTDSVEHLIRLVNNLVDEPDTITHYEGKALSRARYYAFDQIVPLYCESFNE